MFRSILLLAGLCFSQTYNLRGVEIYSTNVVHFGRWETRMKAAATPGTVSSFFVYYPNSSTSSTGAPYPWREIDIEVLGKSGFGFQSNLITGTAASQTTSEAYHTLAFDLSSSYHTYTLDWTPDSVVWRIDGTTVRKTTPSSQQVVDLRDSSDTYRMNLWASNSPSWAGTLDTSKLPVLQIVHWMRYSAYTPNAGPGGSNFTPSWTDSFQNINTSRWAFGNWTFTGNYATFTNSNAKVQNGYLVMMLSTVGKMGQFPSSFPRDTAGTTGLREGMASSTTTTNSLSQVRPGVWATPSPNPALEAFDVRGQRIARGSPSAGGQILDLRMSPRGLILVRQGSSSSWEIFRND